MALSHNATLGEVFRGSVMANQFRSNASIWALRRSLIRIGLSEIDADRFIKRLREDITNEALQDANTRQQFCEEFAKEILGRASHKNTNFDLGKRIFKTVSVGLSLGVAGNLLTDALKTGISSLWRPHESVDKRLGAKQQEDLALIEVKEWVNIASTSIKNPLKCREAAERVDSLIMSVFGRKKNFEIEHAKVWCYVAKAYCDDIARCEDAAWLVDIIAKPFAGDRDFEFERAHAWRYVASTRNDATGCEHMARLVDTIAKPFAGGRDFELVRAQAWKWCGR